ncbi:MAG: SMP-30/gluconolactonase/LRE family protein [Burkholderiaceae bacterium]
MNEKDRTTAFREVVPADSTLEKLATGFGFTEGPIWHPTEHYLIFSDIACSVQYRWTEKEGVRVFRTPSNQANGNAFDRDGRVLSCEHASSQLVRHEHYGKLIKPLATHYQSKELNSPNDVVVDTQNRIWFTDPSFGRIRKDLGILRDQELDFRGVFRLDPDGSLTLVTKALNQPNGLCFSLDESKLFINDSAASQIHVFDVDEVGALTNRSVWAEISGEGEGVPDGMKVSTQGHILCNGPGGVHVLSPDAQALGVIQIPEKSTNFTFGGSQQNDLFVTASTSVYRIRLAVSGPPWF